MLLADAYLRRLVKRMNGAASAGARLHRRIYAQSQDEHVAPGAYAELCTSFRREEGMSEPL